MTQNNTSFDFSEIGKRTPYRVPDGFFADNEKKLIAQTETHPVKRHIPLRRWVEYAAVASVLLVIMIYPVVKYRTADVEPIYTSQEDWSQFAEADLFLENMNW